MLGEVDMGKALVWFGLVFLLAWLVGWLVGLLLVGLVVCLFVYLSRPSFCPSLRFSVVLLCLLL